MLIKRLKFKHIVVISVIKQKELQTCHNVDESLNRYVRVLHKGIHNTEF